MYQLVIMSTRNGNKKSWREKVANEIIGKKRKARIRNRLRIWNEELQTVINGKQNAYLELLQKNAPVAKDRYNQRRNFTRQLTRQTVNLIRCDLKLLQLFNMCWKRYQIPNIWKTAEVISLFKKGDGSHCKNYRGTSLLNAAAKIDSTHKLNLLKSLN